MKVFGIFLVLFSLSISVFGQEITWYSGGKGKVNFDSLSSSVKFKWEVKLPTTQKAILIEITNPKGVKSQLTPDLENGVIIIDYLFRDGPGNYQIAMYGAASTNDKSFAGIASFTVKSTENIPTDYPGINDVEMAYMGGGKGKVKFSPIKKTNDFSVRFEGTSSLKTLMLEFKKNGGNGKQFTVPLNGNQFAFEYLFKEGPGNYTVTVFGDEKPTALSFRGIQQFNLTTTKAVPKDLPGLELNDAVIDFVNKSVGKSIGRGECWDLAQEALDLNSADWTRPVNYGILLDPNKDEVKPGDIIQFLSVTLEEKLPNGKRTESYGAPDHTAVVYEVYGKLKFKLAHQNVGGKRFVVFGDIDFNNLKSGKYWIWRPISAILP